jgi:hypothetical protein
MQIQILNLEQLFNCPYSPKFETNSASQYERHIVIKHPGYQDIAVAEQILADYNICNQQLFVMSYVDKKNNMHNSNCHNSSNRNTNSTSSAYSAYVLGFGLGNNAGLRDYYDVMNLDNLMIINLCL